MLKTWDPGQGANLEKWIYNVWIVRELKRDLPHSGCMCLYFKKPRIMETSPGVLRQWQWGWHGHWRDTHSKRYEWESVILLSSPRNRNFSPSFFGYVQKVADWILFFFPSSHLWSVRPFTQFMSLCVLQEKHGNSSQHNY